MRKKASQFTIMYFKASSGRALNTIHWLITLFIIFFPPLLQAQEKPLYSVQLKDTITDFHDIEAHSNKKAWLYGYGTGEIFATKNSGRSWIIKTVLDSLYYEQIQLLRNRFIFICGDLGTVFISSDQGKSWLRRGIQLTEGRILLYAMLFQNPKKGIVAGAVRTNGVLYNKIFTTSNSGISWTVRDTDDFLFSIKKDRHGILRASGQHSILVLKKDFSTRVLFKDSLGLIQRISSFDTDKQGKTIIAVSFSGHILRSADVGKSWQLQKISPNHLRDIQCIGKNKWLAVGDKNRVDSASNIFISFDNGCNWQQVSGLPDIHRLSSSKKFIWLAGRKGFIKRIRKKCWKNGYKEVSSALQALGE